MSVGKSEGAQPVAAATTSGAALRAIEIAPAAQGDDARAAIGVRAYLFTQVADVHIEAAVVEGQLAAQGNLRELLFVQRLARLTQ